VGTTTKAHVIHVEVLSSTASRVVDVYADRIDFLRLSQQATATGRVEGHSTDPATGDVYNFWSDEAFFDGQTDQIVLSGIVPSVVVQVLENGTRTIKGDKIVYFDKDQRMISEGNAQAVFEDRGDGKK